MVHCYHNISLLSGNNDLIIGVLICNNGVITMLKICQTESFILS